MVIGVLSMCSNYILLWPIHYIETLRKFDKQYKLQIQERSAYAQWAGAPIRLLLYYSVILFPYKKNQKKGWEQLVFNKNDDLRADSNLIHFILGYFCIGTHIFGIEAIAVAIIHDFLLVGILGLEPIIFK